MCTGREARAKVGFDLRIDLLILSMCAIEWLEMKAIVNAGKWQTIRNIKKLVTNRIGREGKRKSEMVRRGNCLLYSELIIECGRGTRGDSQFQEEN